MTDPHDQLRRGLFSRTSAFTSDALPAPPAPLHDDLLTLQRYTSRLKKITALLEDARDVADDEAILPILEEALELASHRD